MRYLISLLIIFTTMSTHAQEKTPVKIQTPHGTVEWKVLPTIDGSKITQLTREITPEEALSLRSDADAAVDFVKRYALKEKKESHPLDALDFAFAGWLASADPKKESSDRVIRVLGSAYGFYCIDHLGMRWGWIKDEFGEDIALVREKPDARGFPFSSIRYRIEDKKADFIYALYASLEYLIADASRKGGPNKTTADKPPGVAPAVSKP